MKVRPHALLHLVLVLLLLGSTHAGETAPYLVYGTYLGGSAKECATGIAVDRSGNAYVVGRTPSPDFPVTPRAFSNSTQVNNNDWTGFVSKINERGDHLLYSSFLGGNFRSSANAVAVDSAGRAFVAGSTCSSNFPTSRSAVLHEAGGTDKIDACDGFLAWLNPEGSQLEYGSFLGGNREDAATAVSLAPAGDVVYVAGYTFSPNFPVTKTAFQSKLNGTSNGFLSSIDRRSGKLLYSTYLGGSGNDRVTAIAIAIASDGAIYVSGITDSRSWLGLPLRHFGATGATDGFVVRLDPTGTQPPFGIRIGGSGNEDLTSVVLDSRGDIYVCGSTSSPNFPLAGVIRNQVGGGFVMKIDGHRFARGQLGVIWSRRLGGRGDEDLLSLSAGMPHAIFVSGRSGSKDFPVTRMAIHNRLEAENDSTLIELRASDGQIRYATFVGGTRKQHASWYNDEATGVVATASGDVYVAGCTLDNRLPVSKGALQPQPKGNSEPFVLRIRF